MKHLLLLAIIVFVHYQIAFTQNTFDVAGIEKVFGKKGTVQNNVFKITFPRSDLLVKVGNVPIEPGLALTSWVAIMKFDNAVMNMNDSSMMMGDLVLLDAEVASVVSQLVSLGLEVTAIHNHLLGETPAVKYLHYYGKGEAVKLAEEIKSVLAVTATPLGASSVSNQSAAPDWSKVQSILGAGKQNGDLLQYGFPRNEKTMDHGMEVPPFMGTATAINFQMNGKNAATAGDFVLLADEVNDVVKALTESGISVTALHNHMLFDEPRLFMLHFWGAGDPEQLARALKAALDKINLKK
ncbi:MAG TPA: DUF1259 domain-containing protein [Chitinophagales bacterium]|nr:DUF1259 domain-containing protein [Chitinophagales bacterium]